MISSGDILVAATHLNDEVDDHKGAGRIDVFAPDLTKKGSIPVGSSHLLSGLTVDRDGSLWLFEMNSRKVHHLSPAGDVLPVPPLPERGWSNCAFLNDGSILFGDHFCGAEIPERVRPMIKTPMSFPPGLDRFGDGHVWRIARDGAVLNEYATATHGGMVGFLGVTCMVPSADNKVLYYITETTSYIKRFDLVAGRQMDDLVALDASQREMVMGIAAYDGNSLVATRNSNLERFDMATGERVSSVPLEGRGWAPVAVSNGHAICGNYFDGRIVRMDPTRGEILASGSTDVARGTTAIAVFP